MRLLPIAFAVFAGSAVQAQPTPTLSFDVASIRPAEPGSRDSVASDPVSLTIRNVTLHRCLEWAYDVQPFQVSGPSWLNDALFDITARTATPSSEAQQRLMLRSLLAERFGVKLHVEPKEMSVYLLVAAKNGPRFHEETPKDASKFVESTSVGSSAFGKGKGGLTAERVRMAEVARQISEPMERPVIDRTGLTGRYDIRLDVSAFVSTGEIDIVSFILTGFQAQLGLKLEPAREKVDLLVIDAANKSPAEN